MNSTPITVRQIALLRRESTWHSDAVTDTVRRLSGQEPIGVAELLDRQRELLRSVTATR